MGLQISINGVVKFSTNNGIWVAPEILEYTPEEIHQMIATATIWINHPYVVDACCGAQGPLAEYSELTFDEFMKKLKDLPVTVDRRRKQRTA